MKPRIRKFNFLLCILTVLISFQAHSQTLITPFSATASHSYSGFPPSNAIDGNSNSFWSAGVTDIVSPYIEIDLGPNGDTKIARVELVVAQSPAGLTTHSISGRTSSGMTVSFGQVTSYTDHQQLISVPVSSNIAVRYIRVQTSLSPSWPAWAEIRAYKPAAQNLIGQLSASPNECEIPIFNQSCSVQLSWNISPANSAFTLWIENSPLYGTTWITQVGSTIGIPFVREGSNQFVLRAGSADPNGAVIARTTVIGRQAAVIPTANLSASPATCQVNPQTQTCASQLTWAVNPANTPVSLWLNTSTGLNLVTSSVGGSSSIQQIREGSNAYILKQGNNNPGGQTLASINVEGAAPTPVSFPKKWVSYFITANIAPGVNVPNVNFDDRTETVDHTTLDWINIYGPQNTQQLAAQINNTPLDRFVILGGEDIFFGGTPLGLLGPNYGIYEAQSNWNRLLSLLTPYGYQKIYAVFPVDEPDLRNIVESELLTAANIIRNTPHTGSKDYRPKVGTLLAWTSFSSPGRPSRSQIRAFGTFDLVGLDCYPTRDGTDAGLGTFESCNGISIPDYLEKFRALDRATLVPKGESKRLKKYIVVAETGINFDQGYLERQKVIANLEKYERLAAETTDVEGLLLFNYRGKLNDKDPDPVLRQFYGNRDLTDPINPAYDVMRAVRRISKCVSHIDLNACNQTL